MTRPPRIPEEAGYCSPSRLPRGPNGNALCRKCGEECPGKRNTFCSDACVHEWRLRSDTGYQAKHVLERDKGVCEACGRDCLALLDDLKAARRDYRMARGFGRRDEPERSYGFEIEKGSFAEKCDAIGLPPHLRYLTRRLWEMDHRVPVAEGGGSCGLENLRTLCWACHRAETKALAKRRAEARRSA